MSLSTRECDKRAAQPGKTAPLGHRQKWIATLRRFPWENTNFPQIQLLALRVRRPLGRGPAHRSFGTAESSWAFAYLQEFADTKNGLVTQAGFEPATPSFGGWCSIQLSYWATRTGGPLSRVVVGRTGLEPVTSAV